MTRTPKQIAADKVAELIEKLEKAEGPNYRLEIDIFKFFNPEYADYVEGRGGLVHVNDGEDQRVRSNIRAPNYTASLDAAVALMGRVFPGWHYSVGGCPADFLTPGIDKPFSAELMGPVTWRVIEREIGQEPTYDSAHGSAQTAPLALCLAILKAVRAHMHPRDREETNQ